VDADGNATSFGSESRVGLFVVLEGSLDSGCRFLSVFEKDLRTADCWDLLFRNGFPTLREGARATKNQCDFALKLCIVLLEL
jgi:hypothetical protein